MIICPRSTTRLLTLAIDETAQEEVEGTDLRVLEAEEQRLERRLSFWRARVQELQAADT